MHGSYPMIRHGMPVSCARRSLNAWSWLNQDSVFHRRFRSIFWMASHSAATRQQGMSFMSDVAAGLVPCKLEDSELEQRIKDCMD